VQEHRWRRTVAGRPPHADLGVAADKFSAHPSPRLDIDGHRADPERTTMSKIAERSAKAQENIDTLESALDRTQQALRAAEKADLAAAAVTKKSRKFLKLVVVLTVIGVAVLVVKKLAGGGSNPPGTPDPYGTDSTEK
jgi:hypothetical protein